MSAHDDYLDVKDAFERFEKAYVAWGRAVDGNPETGWEPASESVQRRMATRFMKASAYLSQQSANAIESFAGRGWKKPK